jgi:uncharacterized protein (TIGR00251 family)
MNVPASTRLPVKVVPGASTNAIVGWLGDDLKVRVSAAPEKGKANAAVCKLIADQLGITRDRVQVVAGHTSQRKVIEIEDLNHQDVLARLSPNSPNSDEPPSKVNRPS